MQNPRGYLTYIAACIHKHRRIQIVPCASKVAGFVSTARGKILEDGAGHLNSGPRSACSHTTSSNWQIADKSFECRIVGPSQLRRTDVDVILVKGLDVEAVRAGTLEPEPILTGGKILTGKYFRIYGVRLSIS